MEIEVRPLTVGDVPACRKVLESVPQWFGRPDANEAYIASLERLPGFLATVQGDTAGFMALQPHGDRSAEIHVIAVDIRYHRRGVGQALVGRARSWCRERQIPWLFVKTLGPSNPDANYAATRQFYESVGFDALYESFSEWDQDTPALIMVQRVDPADPPAPGS